MRCKSDCGNILLEDSSSFICCAALQHKKWFYCDAIAKVRSYFCIHFSSCLSALKTGEVFCSSPTGICILARAERDCM